MFVSYCPCISAVLCPELPDPPHGKTVHPDRSHRAVAVAQCDEGYVFSRPDSNRRHCLSNNTWSKQQEGKCEGCVYMSFSNFLRIYKGSQRVIRCAYRIYDKCNVTPIVPYLINRISIVYLMSYLMIQSKYNCVEN